MPIIDDIRVFRGLEQNLPTLLQGQPAVTLDTNKFFVGTPNGNIEFAQQSAVSVLQKTPQEYEWTTTAGQIVYVLPSGTTYDTSSKWLTFTVGGAIIEDSLIKKDSPTQFTLLVDPSVIPASVKAVARWVMPYIPAGDNLPSQVAANTTSLVDITTNQLPSKAKQVDLDATNSQVSANTNAISNIGTINANAELVNARGTYSQLVNRLNASDASLVDITTKVLYMSHYKLLAGETTDDGRFTRMLADLQDGYILFFEANANYTLTSRKQFTQNNIKVFGCGATISYNGTDATEILLIGKSSSINQSGQNISVTINTNSVTLPNVTSINIGDLFMGYNSTAVNGYSDGIYAEVVDIDTTNMILKLSIDAHKSFTITNYSVYPSVDGVSISDININCNTNMKNIAFNFNNVKNSSFINLSADGKGGRAGITLQGINCEIKRCKFTNFYDNALVDNVSGYGIDVAGHNINVELNNIKKCKHTLTAGTRLIYSTGIHFNKNLCYRDPSNALSLPQIVDMHSNVEGTITNNKIYNVGTQGIAVRGDNVTIEGNHMYSIYSTYQPSLTLRGILAYDNTQKNIIVKNNVFHGFYSIIFSLETAYDAPFQNFIIEDNISDFGGIGFGANSGSQATVVKNISVSRNVFLDEASINFSNTGGQGILIDGNNIHTGNNIFNIGVVVNSPTSLPMIIKNNLIYHGTQGGECIRVWNDWNIIMANSLTMGNTTTNPINLESKTNNIKANNLWIKSDGTIQTA